MDIMCLYLLVREDVKKLSDKEKRITYQKSFSSVRVLFDYQYFLGVYPSVLL